ncbi:MAG: intradiol ring-cleavage dioxygenase [Bacteroidetes bacterium]|nr:MAG: intradiol ring-cleavage dioxygenase [Bacteroidota bacterium]
MRLLFLFGVLLISNIGCTQNSATKTNQNNIHVGGSCEGCEAIHESPTPFDSLKNLCWLPDWNDKGRKLAINGVVYKSDGTPAPNVIIYVYHTDQTGIYPKKGDETGWGKRHGYIRGWMRTNEKGEYKFFTLRPAAYPGRQVPEHIHVTIKEPDKNEYWIDEYLFDDDPLLTDKERKNCQDRGGSGIIKVKDVGNMLKAERNIYLGKNIPDYPKK